MSILVGNEQTNWEVGPYTLFEEIGEGSTSSVRRAIHTKSHIAVAIKIISKRTISTPNKHTRFIREIELLKKTEHPLIIEFYQHFEDEENHYLVMEYMPNGNLASFINENGALSLQLTKRMFTQIFSVLEYLHKKLRVAHRDLKAENILLDENFNIRVIDFGLSKGFSGENDQFNTKCGSKCMYLVFP
jgi:serine/threonine protein kinase